MYTYMHACYVTSKYTNDTTGYVQACIYLYTYTRAVVVLTPCHPTRPARISAHGLWSRATTRRGWRRCTPVGKSGRALIRPGPLGAK